MTRATIGWDEMAALFAAAVGDERHMHKKRGRGRDEADAYLNHGCRDYVVEDASGNIVKPTGKRQNIDSVCRAVLKAEKPVRITLAIHPEGDGIMHRNRRKTVLMKLKKHVWFFDGASSAEIDRNIQRGMPAKMVSLLYGIDKKIAQERCLEYGFKLAGAR